MKGRILVAREGINGTLSASSESVIDRYIQEVEGFSLGSFGGCNIFQSIDWKKSCVEEDFSSRMKEPFPDLKISVQSEIVSSGGIIKAADLPQFGGKHLSPEQFHSSLLNGNKNLVVIDVRNTFEHAIGRFIDGSGTHALNPAITTFSAFDASFCSKNAHNLKGKQVLMYCTGGIRCEKASAMLRKRGVNDVSQLAGGIHRYLERYKDGGLFAGKNFVFDQRVALSSEKSIVVGQCIECYSPYDELSGSRVCSVCRDLVLVCPSCQNMLREYHCEKHEAWKCCYFTFLDVFNVAQLTYQAHELNKLRNSNQSKNTRRTLMKQIEKVNLKMTNIHAGNAEPNTQAPKRCRTCFLSSVECDGLCWGFWKTSSKAENNDSSL